MVHWLRVLAALREESHWLPSSESCGSYLPASRGADAFFWPPQRLCSVHKSTHNTHNTKQVLKCTLFHNTAKSTGLKTRKEFEDDSFLKSYFPLLIEDGLLNIEVHKRGNKSHL